MTAAGERRRYEAEVAAYVAAGGEPTVQRVITAVHGLHRRLSRWYDAHLSDVRLTSGEWGVLAQLATAPEGELMTPSRLAQALVVAPSSMTHRLDKLAERELVTRVTDPDNRTKVLVELTPTGWQLFQKVVRESDVVESDVLARLSPRERDALADMLETTLAGLDDTLDPQH